MGNRTERLEPIGDLGSGRDDFDRDYTAILYSHAFRRLKHKTQVFFYPHNDHVCTRLDHSLYVSAISEIVCNNLRSEDIDCEPKLARTIGIGHDLGHAPFGHAGEEALNRLAKDIGGFKHERHGLRIVDRIEKPTDKGAVVGLNLTLAVRDGIVNHCGEDKSTSISPVPFSNLKVSSYPFTVEGCVVRLVDRIAYLGRDIEDAMEAGFIKETDVPAAISAIIGTKNGEVVDYFVGDMIKNSNKSRITLSDEAGSLINDLMEFNYEKIYTHDILVAYKQRVRDVFAVLYKRFLAVIKKNGDRIDRYVSDSLKVVRVLGKFIENRKRLYFVEETVAFPDESRLYQRIVIDFMSTLTDNFVHQACSEYFLPKSMI